jgi:hypothetical protein
MSTIFYPVVEPDSDVIREWEANLKARVLYEKGVSYPGISVAIAEFMGVEHTPVQWRQRLLSMGVQRRRQRGHYPGLRRHG